MIQSSPNAGGGPWYRDLATWQRRADAYQKAFTRLEDDTEEDERYALAFDHFLQESITSLIFESNQIESSGSPLGETRAIVDEHPELRIKRSTPKEFATIQRHLDALGRPNVSFEGKSRKERDVLQHQVAATQALLFALEHSLSNFDQTNRSERLFSEPRIQQLHRELSEGLEPNAGNYREIEVSVGLDVMFPSASLVPNAMKHFVEESNALVDKVVRGADDRYRVAAHVSHRFVSIHPFSDYNGRLSRLLMNMVLTRFGLPFMVPLRSDREGKRRYRSALRSADNGHLDRYVALIVRGAVTSFEELDTLLRNSGLTSLRDVLQSES